MSDIIVTTPKGQMAAAAAEAEDARKYGGDTMYFRRVAMNYAYLNIRPGERIYYVEDGFVRGFALLDHTLSAQNPRRCDTTGREWPEGYFLFMRADSWQWIRPIPMRGFQGWHYARFEPDQVEIVGGWLDPKPVEVTR
jgi:hypothetical protein